MLESAFGMVGLAIQVVGQLFRWSGCLPDGRLGFSDGRVSFSDGRLGSQVVVSAFHWNGQVSVWHGRVNFSTISSTCGVVSFSINQVG